MVSVKIEKNEGRNSWGVLIIEMIHTVVQADIGSSSSKRFFSSEPTESVQAIVEVYVDHRFADLDRTLDESAAVVERCFTDGKPSTVDPLQITSWGISWNRPKLYRDLRRRPAVCFVP